MKQSQFYYLLRRGLFKGASIVKEGLVMFNKFTTAGISHPAQGSAEFDGASDYIQLDTPFSYTNNTFSAWVYADGTGWRTIYSNNDGGASDGIRVVVQSDNTLRYQINTSGFSRDIPQNEWAHVACTYNGSLMSIYINGSLVGDVGVSQTIDVTTNARIGRLTYAGEYFNGNLANVAIWNRALSSDEINSVMWKSYDALEASEKSGLQAWYRLDDISGTSVPDSSGNGNNGTAY